MIRFFATILLTAVLVANAAEKLCESSRSVQQVLDDGRVAVIVQQEGKTDERCHSGWLIESATKHSVLFYVPSMSLLGTDFFYQCRIMAGLADGSRFWGISNDTIGGTSTRDRLYVQGSTNARALPDNLPGDALYLSEDGVHAAIFSAPGTMIFGMLEGINFTEESRVELKGVGNTGFRPALNGDLSVVYYLSEGEMQSLELQRYDVATGAVEFIENIGVAERLGLHADGMYLSDKTALACSADGTVVDYPYYFGSAVPVNCLRTAIRGQDETQWTFENATKTLGEEPAVSSDGRFVAYRKDGAAFRYDTVKATTERLSDAAVVVASAPAISPSGRYVAFMDGDAALWRADCGGCLSFPVSDVYGLPQADGSRVDIGIGVLGFSGSEAEILWEFCDENESLCGRLLDANGAEVIAGKRYSAATLPWSIATDGTQGDCSIRVSLFLLGDDELVDSHVIKVVISDFRCLTEDLSETLRSYIYRSLHFRKNGLLAFATNAGLCDADTDVNYDVYSVNTETARIVHDGMQRCYVINGNSSINYWIDTAGNLCRSDSVEPLLKGVSTALAKPAVSADGSTVAVVKEGRVYVSTDFGETFEALSESGSWPCVSEDSGVIAWVESGRIMIRVGAAGIYAWDEETEAVSEQRTLCLTQAGDEIDFLCGISGNGRSLLFRRTDKSYALLKGGVEAPIELPIPENATDAVLSANGRRVAYIAKITGDSTSRLYYLDLDKETMAPVCTMPEAKVGTSRDGSNSNAGYLAISADGRQIAFASYGDMVNGGVKESDTAPCRLYVWNDKAWSNEAPSFGNNSLICTEDSLNSVLPIECSANDGDELTTRLVAEPSHGSAALVMKGDSNQPYALCYTPESDFVGTDTLRLSCSDGTVSVEAEFTIEVENVNDAPVWDDERASSEVSVTVGDSLNVQLFATDVDLANPVPDVLSYSLGEGMPKWCSVATLSSGEGVLTLSPHLPEVGEHVVEVVVSDGIERVPFEISVTVNVPQPVAIPVALLLDSSLAPANPSTYGEWLLAWSAGCWENLHKGFQALSLPGDADMAQICKAFGVNAIYVYDDELGYRACKTGILAAGSGFWVSVNDAPEGEITLQPKPRAEKHRFVGPVWEDETPEKLHFSHDGGAWQLSSEWKIGHGYFVDIE